MHAFRLGRLIAVSASLLVLASCLRGCDSRRPPIHLNPNMDDQPKYKPLARSDFFYSGSTSQSPVPGTIARGELPTEDPSFETGKSFFGFYVEDPLSADSAVIARGRERFQIFCVPCHGPNADGHGVLFERAGIESADLHSDKVRQMPDGRIFEVVTKGSGLMKGYRHMIAPRDRWAIVAYLRRLQGETRER